MYATLYILGALRQDASFAAETETHAASRRPTPKAHSDTPMLVKAEAMPRRRVFLAFPPKMRDIGQVENGFYRHLMSRVAKDAESGCWNSDWAITKGYSTIWHNGKMARVHRLMYEHHVDAIPPALTIDHLCRNRRCCNPAHLEVASRELNGLRGYQAVAHLPPNRSGKRKSHCPNGHKYTARDIKPCGAKQCRECENARRRAEYARKTVAAA